MCNLLFSFCFSNDTEGHGLPNNIHSIGKHRNRLIPVNQPPFTDNKIGKKAWGTKEFNWPLFSADYTHAFIVLSVLCHGEAHIHHNKNLWPGLLIQAVALLARNWLANPVTHSSTATTINMVTPLGSLWLCGKSTTCLKYTYVQFLCWLDFEMCFGVHAFFSKSVASQ